MKRQQAPDPLVNLTLNRKSKTMIIGGCDPGKNTALVIMDMGSRPRLLWSWTGEAFDVIWFLAQNEGADHEVDLIAIINQIGAGASLLPVLKVDYWSMEWPQAHGKILYGRNRRREMKPHERDRLCVDVGSNLRSAELLDKAFRRAGKEVYRFTPRDRKWDNRKVATLLSLPKFTSNEHVRDGVRACFGFPGKTLFDQTV